MSSKQCTHLSKLAQRGVNLPRLPVVTSVRNFYNSPNFGESFRQACRRNATTIDGAPLQQQKLMPGGTASTLLRKNKFRKVIGVKKTLVNQMQGMMRISDPNKSFGPYKIYGKTRLFSSTSSLQSQSPGLLCRRWMSTQLRSLQRQQERYRESDETDGVDGRGKKSTSRHTASLSATQRRYNQSANSVRGMAIKLAQDISQSIQEELMVVDAETLNMLNCDPNRQNPRDPYEQQARMAENDPLRGWNRPSKLKHLSEIAVSAKSKDMEADSPTPVSPQDAGRTTKVRRRQLVIKRPISTTNGITRISESSVRDSKTNYWNSTGLNYKAALPQFNGITASHSVRPELRPFVSWQGSKTPTPDPSHTLMDVAMAKPRQTVDEKAASKSPYVQPKSEKDLLERIIFSGARPKGDRLSRQDRNDPLTDKGIGKSDSRSTLISASQQVINKKYAGFRRSQSGIRDAVKQKRLAEKILESVDQTPQLYPKAVLSTRETQPQIKNRGLKRRNATRVATPSFSMGNWKTKEHERDEVQKDSEFGMVKIPHRTSNFKPSKKSTDGPSTRDPVQREQWSKTKPTVGNGELIGESRDSKRTEASVPPPTKHSNDIKMPRNYCKESAIQRLGSFPLKRSSRDSTIY